MLLQILSPIFKKHNLVYLQIRLIQVNNIK